jgi:hypothetical protein
MFRRRILHEGGGLATEAGITWATEIFNREVEEV